MTKIAVKVALGSWRFSAQTSGTEKTSYHRYEVLFGSDFSQSKSLINTDQSGIIGM